MLLILTILNHSRIPYHIFACQQQLPRPSLALCNRKQVFKNHCLDDKYVIPALLCYSEWPQRLYACSLKQNRCLPLGSDAYTGFWGIYVHKEMYEDTTSPCTQTLWSFRLFDEQVWEFAGVQLVTRGSPYYFINMITSAGKQKRGDNL